MTEEPIESRRFKKRELLKTLERLFLGHYISPLNDVVDSRQREEISLNYMAMKDIIKKSEAS